MRVGLLRRIFHFRFLFAVNLAVAILLGYSFGREYIRNQSIQKDIRILEEKATALEARNLEIAKLQSTFQSETFIEREARLKLGMKKPGEKVVVVQRPWKRISGADIGLSGLDDGSSDQLANPVKWWYYFFDITRFRQLSSHYGT